MAAVGSIEPFNASTMDWPTYSERLGQYLLANDVADDKTVATFLTVIGETSYKLLTDLLSHFPSLTKHQPIDPHLHLLGQPYVYFSCGDEIRSHAVPAVSLYPHSPIRSHLHLPLLVFSKPCHNDTPPSPTTHDHSVLYSTPSH